MSHFAAPASDANAAESALAVVSSEPTTENNALAIVPTLAGREQVDLRATFAQQRIAQTFRLETEFDALLAQKYFPRNLDRVKLHYPDASIR